jgi:hypothetical protein
LNSRIPHLKGKSIFGSAKRKLDLLPRDESDSHYHDWVNFSLPKIGRRMIPGQSRHIKQVSESIGDALPIIGFTKSSLPVCEFVCDPMA